PTNIIIVYSLFAFTGLTTYRTLIKIFFQYSKTKTSDKKNVIVYGAGDLGIAVKRTFDHDLKSNNYIVAYLADDESKIGKYIDCMKRFCSSDSRRLFTKLALYELIFASDKISTEKKKQVIDISLEQKINVLTLPPVSEIINGTVSPTQIKKVKIEELLERAPIKLKNDTLSKQLRGKRILVTGAAGSIGSEIAKQLGYFEPQLIILCDQAESPLHNLHLDLQDRFKSQAYQSFIADVKNEERMRI